MKNKNLFILFMFITPFIYSQVDWPLPPFNTQLPINGTIGEYRNNNAGTNPRFHKGTDVDGNGNVYAVEDGTVLEIKNIGLSYEQVRVNNTWYVHVDVVLTHNDPVTAGVTVLGTILSNHVHLEEQNRNFLNTELYPYVDDGDPDIHATSFRRNGHNRLVSKDVFDEEITIDGEIFTILYGKVDIVANIDDPMNGGNSQVAPNWISYDIMDYGFDLSIDGAVENFNFNLTPNNTHADSCFGVGTTMSNFNYILTSHPIENPAARFWRTDLRAGENENWATNNNNLDTETNLTAHYPDDTYIVHIETDDVDYEDDPTEEPTEEDMYALLDNFQPFIQEVTITSGDQIYSENWSWDDTGAGQLVFSNNNIGGVANGQNDVVVHITTSELMNGMGISILNFGSNHQNQPCIAGATDKEWVYEISADYILNTAVDGEYTIQLEGVDYAGNTLEGFQNTNNLPAADIPSRQIDGSWVPPPSPSPTYYDIVHILIIQHESELTPDFSASSTNIEVGNEVQFSDLSVPANQVTAWSWEFEGGTPATSNEQNPTVSYNSTGSFEVKLTVYNSSGAEFTRIKDDYIGVWETYVDFSFGQNFNAAEYTVDFTDQSFGEITKWDWNFGDGNTSNEQHPSHIYSVPDTYTVTLEITTPNGTHPISKSVLVVGEQYEDIIITTYRYQLFDYDYEFIVDVDDPDQSHSHEIILNFGDGSPTVSVANNQPYPYTYAEPSQTTIVTPNALVITKDANGQTIDQQTVFFSSISLFISSYVLDITIDEVGYIQPGGSANFSASATNAVGQVSWSWRINTNVDDINGFCNPFINPGNCFAEGGFTLNEPYNTASYTFQNAGTYIISASANDIAGKQGYKEFYLIVGDVEDECLLVGFEGSVCNIANEYEINTELMQNEVAGRIFIDACMSGITGRWKYDEIKCIEFYFNGVLDPTNKFEFTHEGGYAGANNVFGCTYLNSLELHTVSIRAYGGVNGSMDPATGTHFLEYYNQNKPYSSITKSFNVINCNENITITTQSELNNHNGNILAGNITINPGGGNQITLSSSEVLNIKAYNELVLHPGVLLEESSSFEGMHKLCPDLDCDCYGTKSSSADSDILGSLLLYPNPTPNKLNVTISYPDDLLKIIEIYNTIGEMIYKKDNIEFTSFSFDVSNQPSGLYIAKIKTHNQSFLRKFIKH